MKFLFDLFPVLLFFIAFKLGDIYAATGVAIAASFVQIAWVWFRHRRVESMMWVSLVIITLFGGMTLFFRDETFIKWKPTVLYWFFAGALAVSHFFFKKNLIRALLSAQLEAPDFVWKRLNGYWIAFFLSMGAANLAVAFGFGLSTETWVDFKVFGGIGLLLVFAVFQGLFLAKYIEEKG